MLDSYFELRMILCNITNDYFYFRFTSLSTGIFFLPSRVVALFGGRPQILAPFSTSETVIGVRSWSDFALSANRGGVSDAFGDAERLLLTASSYLRKDVSIHRHLRRYLHERGFSTRITLPLVEPHF